MKLNGDVVDFDYKLQPVVPAQSTVIAEYRSVTDVCNMQRGHLVAIFPEGIGDLYQ